MTSTDIRPFTIEVPQADLDDLYARLRRTRWTDEPPPGEYGFPISRLRRLVRYWLDGYDWRAWEARLNAYPQFVTEIDGQWIHFLHVRSADPDALLILTHGWPGSVVEYLNLIDRLTGALHLVIPSLPGFAFSGPTKEPGWGVGEGGARRAVLVLGAQGSVQHAAFPAAADARTRHL